MIISYKSVKVTEPAPGITRRVLANSASLMLAEHTLEKDAILPAHSHPHGQLVYLLSGKLAVEMGDERFTAVQGDSFVIAPDIEHRVTCLERAVALDIFTPARTDYL